MGAQLETKAHKQQRPDQRPEKRDENEDWQRHPQHPTDEAAVRPDDWKYPRDEKPRGAVLAHSCLDHIEIALVHLKIAAKAANQGQASVPAGAIKQGRAESVSAGSHDTYLDQAVKTPTLLLH